MNCDKVVTEVYQFLDGELTGVRRSQIEWHLRKCSPCSDSFHFEERLMLLVKRSCTDDEEVPAELFDRLQALIQQETAEGTSGE
jgi:mycothiol system anti-sigma-R factor